MKKGKKMPSIELEGHSEAKFVLVDGKIVRADAMQRPAAVSGGPPNGPSFDIDRRFHD